MESNLPKQIFSGLLAVILTAGTVYYYTHDAHPRNHERDMKYLEFMIEEQKTKQIQANPALAPSPPIRAAAKTIPPPSESSAISVASDSDILVLNSGMKFSPGSYKVRFTFQAKNLYGLGYVVSTNDGACNSARPALDCLKLINSIPGGVVAVYVDGNIPNSSVYIGEK